MTISTTAHLNFPGTAAAALTFYQSVFGGQINLTTYGQLGMPKEAPDAGKVVFGRLESENGLRVMAYDVPGRAEPFGGRTTREHGLTVTDQPFFLSVEFDSLPEASEHWGRLADGAEVVEALAASAWSPGFGMLTDRFGVTWTFGVATEQA